MPVNLDKNNLRVVHQTRVRLEGLGYKLVETDPLLIRSSAKVKAICKSCNVVVEVSKYRPVCPVCKSRDSRGYQRFISLCEKSNLTPNFDRQDWVGVETGNPPVKNRYPVICNRCGRKFEVRAVDSEFKCRCCSVRASYLRAVKICESNGCVLLTLLKDWEGFQNYGEYRKYRVRCLKCGKEFDSWFNDGMMSVCECSNIARQWRSKREIEFQKRLEALNVECRTNVRDLIKGQNHKNFFEVDLYLPTYRVAFEFNGYYFHSVTNTQYPKSRFYHKEKSDRALEKGIKLYHIWEDIPDDVAFDIVLSKIGIYKNRVYARKCSIVSLSDNWFSGRHADGDCRASLRFGLEYDGLVRCGISIRFVKGVPEIARFSNELYTDVVGGYSKLLSHCIKILKGKGYDKLISYCNRDFSPNCKDNIYIKLGFTFVKECPLIYKYYAHSKITAGHKEYPAGVYHRQEFMKHKLEELGLQGKEFEVMDALGFFRVYNSGNYKYEIKL